MAFAGDSRVLRGNRSALFCDFVFGFAFYAKKIAEEDQQGLQIFYLDHYELADAHDGHSRKADRRRAPSQRALRSGKQPSFGL